MDNLKKFRNTMKRKKLLIALIFFFLLLIPNATEAATETVEIESITVTPYTYKEGTEQDVGNPISIRAGTNLNNTYAKNYKIAIGIKSNASLESKGWKINYKVIHNSSEIKNVSDEDIGINNEDNKKASYEISGINSFESGTYTVSFELTNGTTTINTMKDGASTIQTQLTLNVDYKVDEVGIAKINGSDCRNKEKNTTIKNATDKIGVTTRWFILDNQKNITFTTEGGQDERGIKSRTCSIKQIKKFTDPNNTNTNFFESLKELVELTDDSAAAQVATGLMYLLVEQAMNSQEYVDQGKIVNKVTNYGGNGSLSISEDGNYVVKVQTIDNSGNEGASYYLVTIDNNTSDETKPVVTYSQSKSDIQVTINDISGVDSVTYKWKSSNGTVIDNGGTVPEGNKIPIPKDVSGTYTLVLEIKDKLNNTTTKTKAFNIDGKVEKPSTMKFYNGSNEIPVTKKSLTHNGETYDINFIYSKEKITGKVIEGNDGAAAALAETYYKTTTTNAGSDWENAEIKYSLNDLDISEEGLTYVRIYSKDASGNTTFVRYRIHYDKTVPTVTAEVNQLQGTARITCEDTNSGLLKNNDGKIYALYAFTRGYTPEDSEYKKVELKNLVKLDSQSTLTGDISYKSGTTDVLNVPDKNLGGGWILWVKKHDNAMNYAEYNSSTPTNPDNSCPVAGTISAQYKVGNTYSNAELPRIDEQYTTADTVNGLVYTYREQTFSNYHKPAEGSMINHLPDKSVSEIKLTLTPGYDYESNIASETVKIEKNNTDITSSVTKNGNQYTISTGDEESVYKITIETRNNVGKNSKNIYTISVDKKGPVITSKMSGLGSNESSVKYGTRRIFRVFVSDGMSGVNSSKIAYKWVKDGQEISVDGSCVLKPIQETEEGSGVYAFAVMTPDGVTGDYQLKVTAEDKQANSSTHNTTIAHLDNTNPTRPTIDMNVPKGPAELDYNGYPTKENVLITTESAKDKNWISGVDIYEYSAYNESTATWSDWKVISKRSGTDNDIDEENLRDLANKLGITEANVIRDYSDMVTVKAVHYTVDEILADMGVAAADIPKYEGEIYIKTRAVKQERFDKLEEEAWNKLSGVGAKAYNAYPDNIFASSESKARFIKIDRVAPTIEIMNTSINRDDKKGGTNSNWVSSEIIKITASDNSGIKENSLKYKWVKVDNAAATDVTEWTQVNGSIVTTPEEPGKYLLKVTAEDNAGNILPYDSSDSFISKEYWVDASRAVAAPIVKAFAETQTGWVQLNSDPNITNKRVKVTIKAAENEKSIIAKYKYSIDGGKEWETATTTSNTAEVEKYYTDDGTYEIMVKAVNNVGVESAATTIKFNIDKTPPTVTFTPDTDTTPSKSKRVKITVEDKCAGLASTNEYKYVLSDSATSLSANTTPTAFVNGGTITIGEGLTGTYYIHVLSDKITDNFGYKQENNYVSKAFQFDNTAPTITFTPNGNTEYTNKQEVILSVVDETELNASQTKYYWAEKTARVGENNLSEFTAVPSSNKVSSPSNIGGEYKLHIYAEDKVGNHTIVSSNIYKIDCIQPDVSGMTITATVPSTNGAGANASEEIDSGETTGKAVTIEVSGATAASGVKYQYSTNSGKTWNEIVPSNNKYKVTFEDEGSYTVEFRSVSNKGVIAEEIKEISFTIDKTAPRATVSYSEITPAKQVTATIIASEDIKVPTGWTAAADDNKKITKTYSENTAANGETVEIEDLYGNKGSIKVEITNIDNEKPTVVGNVEYSETEKTSNNVIVRIKFNEKIQPIDNWQLSVSQDTITREYAVNVTDDKVKVKDLAGNESDEIKVNINNIDKDNPNLEVTYDYQIDGVVVTITSNKELKPMSEWTKVEDTNEEGSNSDATNYVIEKKYTKSVTEVLRPEDLAGNKGIAPIKVEIIKNNILSAQREIKTEIKGNVNQQTTSGIDEKYLLVFDKDVSIAKLLNNIDTDSNHYKVYEKTTESEKTEIKTEEQMTDTKAKTGKTLIEYTGERYTIVMIGDLNGDGQVNFDDMQIENRIRLNPETAGETLDYVIKLAGDINGDDKVTFMEDLVKLNALRLKNN